LNCKVVGVRRRRRDEFYGSRRCSGVVGVGVRVKGVGVGVL